MYAKFAALAALIASATAQQVAPSPRDLGPSLRLVKCAGNGNCRRLGQVTIDANWRWPLATSGADQLRTLATSGTRPYCNDGTSVRLKCCVDGAEYAAPTASPPAAIP